MPTSEYYVGVLAQELQQASPYMVGSFEYTPDAKNTDNREEYLSVNNGALTYVLVNSVKELDEKTEKLAQALKTVTDFGVATVANGNEIRVSYGEEFSTSLSSGSIPVVTATAMNTAVPLSVKDVTANGFTVVTAGPVQNLSVSWIAACRISGQNLAVEKNYTLSERQQLLDKVKMKKSVIRTTEEATETQRRISEN